MKRGDCSCSLGLKLVPHAGSCRVRGCHRARRITAGRRTLLACVAVLLAGSTPILFSQALKYPRPPDARKGEVLYKNGCIACHGSTGKGAPHTSTEFELPDTFPDFTRCDQTTAETNAAYKDEIMKATSGRGVDIILEMLANVNLGGDLKLLAQYGRVIVIGSRGDVTITPRDLMSRRASVRAFTLWALSDAEAIDVHAGINAGLENGTLRPVVGSEIALKDAAQAHIDVVKPSGAFGKIVLIP